MEPEAEKLKKKSQPKPLQLLKQIKEVEDQVQTKKNL